MLEKIQTIICARCKKEIPRSEAMHGMCEQCDDQIDYFNEGYSSSDDSFNEGD